MRPCRCLVRLVGVGVAVGVVASCTPASESSQTARAGSAVVAVTAAVVPPGTGRPVADTGCRKQGLWASCSVLDRLEHAGLVVKAKAAPATYPFLGVAGTTYGVGAGDDEVKVFVYANEVARRADTDKLDSVTVSPIGERFRYRVPPLLVTSNNLAAVVFTLSDRTRERISLALSAGLPQPKP